MKRIIALIIGIILCCACAPKDIPKEQIYSERTQKNSTLIELSFPDEYGQIHTHQVCLYSCNIGLEQGFAAMFHWPDCKYCKRGQ